MDGDDHRTRVVRPGGGSAAPSTRATIVSTSTAAGVRAAAPGDSGEVVIKQRFVLDQRLGSGGMGAVYRAVDLRKQEADDRDPYVAIKLLNDDFRTHPDAFIALQREARKAQTLAHPNIVNVYDFDRDHDTVFMTMECLTGAPLDVLLSDHPDGLDRDQAVRILNDLMAAMRYAHSHRIAHSDLKPGNVFVTDEGLAKVLDFGIARAVTDLAVAGGGTVTRFDPASLGALTPGYASVEMLEGAEPTLEDDVFALGCIAYELFTGRHPFAGRNAVEARREGLVPRRIAGLPRRQWRALARALEFERTARLASVDQLAVAFQAPRRSRWVALAVVLTVGVSAAAVAILLRAPDEEALRADVTLEVQQQLAVEEVDRLLADVRYGDDWLAAFREVFDEYRALVPAADPGVAERSGHLAVAFLAEAQRRREQGELADAERLLETAAAWGGDTSAEQQNLDTARTSAEQARELELTRTRERLSQEQERLNRELAAERERQQAQQARAREAEALAAARGAFACEGFDADRAREGLENLGRVHPEGLRAQQGAFAAQLAGCIAALAQHNPAAAERLKSDALALLPGEAVLAELVIDPCGALTPGSGGRGARFTCQDDLEGGGRGPELVVVPAPSSGAPVGGVADALPYAMARFETSAADLSHFCRSSGRCGDATFSGNGPATGISRTLAEDYAAWLSAESGFDYRVPDYRHWLHAASAGGAEPDPNRNCTLRAGSVRRGGAPLPVDTGAANPWGLVNAAGNVQELTVADDGLVAAGGHFDDPLSRCTYDTRRPHDGAGDPLTGLRLMRSMANGRG